MTLGVFGGTFNPIHLGHLWLAQQVGHCMGFSKILFIPSHIPPHKKCFVSGQDRLKMVQLAIADNPLFELSDVEIKRAETSYTIDTLRILDQIYHSPLTFIIGSDNIAHFTTWYKWREIAENYAIAIGQRSGADIASIDQWQKILGEDIAQKFRKNFVSMIPYDISSTMIRERYSKGFTNRYLVPRDVDYYILDNKLYDRESN